MTPVSLFRTSPGFQLPVPTGSGLGKTRCFVLFFPSRLSGAGASGTPKEPTVPRWAVKVTHGHRGWEGTRVFVGGEMGCDFWGLKLQCYDGMEISEALYNLPRQPSPFLKACPTKQGLILCCKFSPNLQLAGAEASEMEEKVPTQI